MRPTPWFITGAIFIAAMISPAMRYIVKVADWLANSLLATVAVGTLVILALGMFALGLIRLIKEGIDRWTSNGE